MPTSQWTSNPTYNEQGIGKSPNVNKEDVNVELELQDVIHITYNHFTKINDLHHSK